MRDKIELLILSVILVSMSIGLYGFYDMIFNHAIKTIEQKDYFKDLVIFSLFAFAFVLYTFHDKKSKK